MSWSINPDNGAGGDPAIWDRARSLWAQNGIADFPWLHCHTWNDIYRLIDVAHAEDSPAIGLNIEDVVADNLSLKEVARVLDEEWDGPVHMSTLPWVQNGQGWGYLSRAVAALQIFPDENEPSKHPQDCINHALAEGLTQVTLMVKTGGGNTRETYGQFFSICHSLYTADDISPTAAGWDLWIQPQPCEKVAPPVTPIGEQDGIVASVNGLRDLDPSKTLLVKQGNKWPSISTISAVPLDKWKAWDKLQRTLQILKDDHDGAV